MRELIHCFLAAVVAAGAFGCVRSSYVKQQSKFIGQLSQEVQNDLEQCNQVYPLLLSEAGLSPSTERCQEPSCRESSAMPAATPSAPLSTTGKIQQVAAEAADKAQQSADRAVSSADVAREAATEASKSARDAHEAVVRAIGTCSRTCAEARERCVHGASQIQRVIDAAGELEQRAR